jgi:HK97 family phage portal protein
MANFIQRWFGLQKRAPLNGARDPGLIDLLGGRTTEAGVRVDEASALTCATVWAAVRVISEGAASLPLLTYRRNGSMRERATEHPLYNLLHDEPCPGIGSLVWREALFAHALTFGNGYAEIERRAADGTPVALWLLSPERVEPYRENDGNIYYKVTQPKGGHVTLAGANVIHLRGLGGDGVMGYSVIRTARESLGLTIAAQQFGAKLFGTGARPSGVLEHPGRLSDDARQRLRADYERLHSGLDNAHRIAILEEGMKWQALGVPPDDAQFLQTRQFQVAEVARWFNVPSSKLRDNTGQTYSSIEAENQAFYTETLRPWLIRFEQELSIKLLNTVERRTFYFEHLIEGLLRADVKTRFEVYALAKNWGIYSTNEIRERENLPPIEGGDQFLQPLNMHPVALAPAPSPSADSTPAGAGAAPTRKRGGSNATRKKN